MINVQALRRSTKHHSHKTPNPQGTIRQGRCHAAHPHATTLRRTTFLKLRLALDCRKCRNGSRFRQFSCLPFRRCCALAAFTFHQRSHLHLPPLGLAVVVARVDACAVHREFRLAFGRLKSVTNIRIVLYSCCEFAGGFVGQVADEGVRQTNAAELFQIFGSEPIGPKAAASGDEAFQSVRITRVQPESCVDRKGILLTRGAPTVPALQGDMSVGGTYVFCFFVNDFRFFLHWAHCLVWPVFSFFSIRSCSFS